MTSGPGLTAVSNPALLQQNKLYCGLYRRSPKVLHHRLRIQSPGHGIGRHERHPRIFELAAFPTEIANSPILRQHQILSHSEAVRGAIVESITTLPQQVRRSLTWDQGAEMAQHAQLRKSTGLDIYFCYPHAPWQRGTNENTTVSYANTSPKELISADTPETTWTP